MISVPAHNKQCGQDFLYRYRLLRAYVFWENGGAAYNSFFVGSKSICVVEIR